MTDHRATDLSYGHLGEATYDIETGEWCFSRDPFTRSIQQLSPLRSDIRPSIHTPNSKFHSPRSQKRSRKLLLRSRPDIFPAIPLISSLTRSPSPALSAPFGRLLALGRIVDVERRHRKATILAIPSGEAGHVLRLIKPRNVSHDWGRQSSARLSLLDSRFRDQGYWVGVGGRILQITFADDGDSPGTWLAVRQANATTIFRPKYGVTAKPPVVPNTYTNAYPSSRLNANPVAVLTAERSRSRFHSDVTFNPWYTRQFAVIDELGSWSIWDIEGGRKENTSTSLLPGKRANIYDGYVPDPTLKPRDNADGWHQILWAGSVSTILILNRRHIAVFDVKGTPTRLRSNDFFAASNSDWILDAHRSPLDSSHLFVLTSSQIFWLIVIPAGEGKEGELGYREFLSYRHFRDTNDTTMRLSILKDDNISAAISSRTTSLINIYTFFSNPDGLDPTSCRGSFVLSKNLNDRDDGLRGHLQTLHFLESPLKTIPNRLPGPEHHHIHNNNKFYQILAVTTDLGLSSGLCIMQNTSNMDSTNPTAPTNTSVNRSGDLSSQHIVDDPWIVPDGEDDDEDPFDNRSSDFGDSSDSQDLVDETRLVVDFSSVYRKVVTDPPRSDKSFRVLLKNAMDRLQQAKKNADLPMTTFLDLLSSPDLSEDLEKGAPMLRNFIESLKEDEDPESMSAFEFSNLAQCSGFAFGALPASKLPDLLQVYDEVSEIGLAGLPPSTPPQTRLAKFRIARRLAVELCLSSIGVSLRKKASTDPSMPVPDDEKLPALLKPFKISRDGSPTSSSSQIPSSSVNELTFGLPTPSQTASLSSQSHASGSEYAEDSAIARLRRYAPSIKSRPDLGTSSMLSQWSSTPGMDPATYSWEPTKRRAEADESGEETKHRRKREAARRKKRTESFLRGESTAATDTSSQPAYTPFGSQPDAGQYPASSQTAVDDVPMTQPVGGAFGSRSAQQGKKKDKKKRAAGFR